MSDRRIQAFLMNSGTGQICQVDSPAFLSARYQAAQWQSKMQSSAEAATGSAQIQDEIGVAMDGATVAARPFDFALFAYAGIVNTYHARAVRAKVKDICGRPWRIVGDGPEGERARLEQFFTRAFGKRSFGAGMGCVWTDYESLGNGYFEVVPTLKGEPAELAHVPAPEIWVRLDGMGYVQHRNGRYSHFRDYFVPEERYLNLAGNDPLRTGKWKGTSLIHFNRYHPWSPYYGIPSIMPAWNALTLWTLAAEYNLTFFSNNAIPDYAVIFEGGEVPKDVVDTVRTYFERHLKGQAHKTLVLGLPDGSKLRFERLTSDAAKEGNFRLLRQDCRGEILHAHGVPPQKVGIVETGSLGGNLATEQIREYKLAIVEPGREMVTMAISRVIERGFGVSDLWLEFEPFDVDDKTANAQIDAAYLDRRVLTPNEVRKDRFPHLEPLDDGDEPLNSAAEDPGLRQAVEQMQTAVAKAVKP